MALKSFDKNQFDESRQFLLDNRCERNHPKRHRTTKRRKALSAKKKRRIATQNALREASYRRYHAKVRAYWSGEQENHP